MALKKSQLYFSLWQSCDELRGSIPDRDLDAFGAYWDVFPSLRRALVVGNVLMVQRDSFCNGYANGF